MIATDPPLSSSEERKLKADVEQAPFVHMGLSRIRYPGSLVAPSGGS